MKKFFPFFGSLTLWAGLLLSLVSLMVGLQMASHRVWWVDALLAVAASVPLSILGAWLAARQAADSLWTRCVVGLHGIALAPLLFFTLVLGKVFLTVAVALPDRWLTPAALGPSAAFLAWCVAGVRLRRWRRQRLAALEPDAGLGWPWAAGLSVGIVVLGAVLFLPFLNGSFGPGNDDVERGSHAAVAAGDPR